MQDVGNPSSSLLSVEISASSDACRGALSNASVLAQHSPKTLCSAAQT
jgi:hypothetical protein